MLYTMYSREKLPLPDDIRACLAWTRKRHTPAEIRLHPSIAPEGKIDGLPVIADKMVFPGEIWVGWKE